ncbi:MAG: hypothetical protein KatS3mg089_0871 [Patescibacteria group bacterium]|nr:MAG: hypothetical protein KatS3mg089_0871 [Patescibacteria group bacterium]
MGFLSPITLLYQQLSLKKRYILLTLLLFILLPLFLLVAFRSTELRNRASTTASLEAEDGTVVGDVQIISDASASSGKYIEFSKSNTAIIGTKYYVDCVNGNDNNSGTSENSAWKSLTKASQANLSPGDGLLLKQGCVFSDSLSIPWQATDTAPIVISSYGQGNPPIIRTSVNNSAGVKISGSYIIIQNITAEGIAPTIDPGCSDNSKGYIVGFQLEDGSHHITLRNVKATGNYAGVYIKTNSSFNKILNSTFANNRMMNPLDTASDNDAGAFGILIHGKDNEIAYNTLSGQDACSYDYGRDGADIEVYKGQRNNIHHNIGSNSDAFTELGGDSSIKAADNIYAYNVFTSSLNKSIFLVTRGSGVKYGPVYRTKLYNNSVYLTGGSSQGFVCHAGCSSEILTMRNNIIKAGQKDGYADGTFDENYNLYGGTSQQFTLGPNSKKADPRFTSTINLHLQAGSPAIDAGSQDSISAGYRNDLDNTPVPQGSAVDMGAYEYRSVLGAKTQAIGGQVLQASSKPITIAAVGDMNPDGNTSTTSPSGKNAAAIAAGLANGSIDAFLGLGDFQYSIGNCSSFVNYWNRLWSGTKSKLYWISAPNHDWEPGRNEDLDDFMNGACPGDNVKSAINAQRGFIGNGDPYSFDIGNWHFAMLSTALWRYDTTKARQVTTWLDNDLAQAKAAGKFLVVAYHDPYFTSNTSSHSRETAVKPWIDIMDKYDVRLTLSGSQHNYERSCPVTKDDICAAENDPNGMTAFQVSTGGIGLRSFTSSPSYIVKRFSDTWGWLKLSLYPDGSFSWQFNPVQGSSTDSGFRPAPGSSISPAPTSTPTPSLTPTPLPSPTPTASLSTPTPTATPCPVIPQNAGSVVTSITIPTEGTYAVWSRIKANDEFNNSYFLQIDDSCPYVVGDASLISKDAWSWVNYQNGNPQQKIEINLKQGTHIIKLIARETGVKVDKLLFLSDSSCIPTDLGDNCTASTLPTPTNTPTPTPTSTPTPISTPTPTPSPTPTSTNTPTPHPTSSTTPTPILGQTIDLLPLADTFVRKDHPTRNYGSSTHLESDGDTRAISYLKFDLRALAGKSLTTAQLSLTITNPSKQAHYIYLLTNTAWEESTINYATRIEPTNSPIASIPPSDKGKKLTINLTPALKNHLGEIITLAITSSSSDGMDFYSKEAASGKPLLSIATDTQSVSTLKEEVFLPIDDTFVHKDNPQTNYGSWKSLEVDGDPQKIIYMKFDLSKLAGKIIRHAELRFRVKDTSYSTQIIRFVENHQWDEHTLNFVKRYQPSLPIRTIHGGKKDTYLNIDVTSVVQLKAGTIFSFLIESNGSDGLDIYSKEIPNPDYRPALIVSY